MMSRSQGSEPPLLLVLEDDDSLRLALCDNLEDEDYEVLAAATLAEARNLLAQRQPALLLADVMLPDGDGIHFCRTLRAQGFSGRILMLTARTLESDLVRGLDAGADDYLAKPYRLAELLARVRALLRRAPTESPTAADQRGPTTAEGLEFAGFTVDVDARRLRGSDDREIALTRTEFDLLLCLIRGAGRAMSRDELLDAVWGADVVVDERTVDNFVANLKRKLTWSEASAFRIAAVRGIGYRMEATVTPLRRGP